ncbi:LAFE_0G02982g1_1 [Lachancea fermentati]|uniref:Diphthamide biosynthesis protein 4 n=1 Tax=Lachancea fermentati TaxID=4955 RepID=A0A1G4MH66_LACFM|nr:LAFE_0G02982g1_1 [Lachancea fermentati]
MSSNKSYYEILGIDTTTDVNGLKKAYKEKLLSIHPDKNRDSSQLGVTIDDLQRAYQVLVDSDLRANYDKELEESYKKQGFHNNGEGLDEYSLDEFYFDPATGFYCLDCPRCQMSRGFEISEEMLEEHCIERNSGGFHVVVQCSACSLWLNVNFDVVEEYEST